MNRPVVKDCIRVLLASLRKLGDSNPRYGNPHGSLANCWFQPLTQTSFRVAEAPFPNANAKVRHLFHSSKYFLKYFSERGKLLYFCLSHHQISSSRRDSMSPLISSSVERLKSPEMEFFRAAAANEYSRLN